MRLQPGLRRTVTVAVSTIIVAALLVMGATIPVPFVALEPGPTLNTLGSVEVVGKDGKSTEKRLVVDVQGVPSDKVTGNLNLTTVSVRDGMSLFDAMAAWLSGRAALQPRDQVYPPGQSTEQVRQENAEQMSGSEGNATAAALRFLDRPTKLVVSKVGSDGPASKALRTGDQIVRVNGTAITTKEQLRDVISNAKPGSPAAVDIVRDGKPQVVTFTFGDRPDTPGKGFANIDTQAVNADPGLNVKFAVGDIGGPSAGMMLALAIIDRLTPGPLTHGKFIAGTGTIADDGDVGEIGGITHKTRAARDAGATVFLVPSGNCAEAKSDAPDGLELVKVDTLRQAVDALGDIGAGRPAPHC